MFKQERTKIFASNHNSTLIIIDRSVEFDPKIEILSWAMGKGWIRFLQNISFDTFINELNRSSKENNDWVWEEIPLPNFNGKN